MAALSKINLALPTACREWNQRRRGPENNVCRVAPFLFLQYIAPMLWRVRNSRGRPLNAPAAFIHPCQPTVAKQPPTGPGWAHELKHDGYRLQIHVRDGRVRLYTMNAADWADRYQRIVEDAAGIKGTAIIDAEVVCAGKDGVRTLTACTAAVSITSPSPALSIC